MLDNNLEPVLVQVMALAARQQAIIWAIIGQHFCVYMTSLIRNELQKGS